MHMLLRAKNQKVLNGNENLVLTIIFY